MLQPIPNVAWIVSVCHLFCGKKNVINHLEDCQKFATCSFLYIAFISRHITELKIHHLYLLITTNDEFDSADPSSIQDARPVTYELC